MVMKKLFYSLAAFALICSCTQEPVTPEETPADDQPVASELVTYTFHATADDVKATISDAGAFAWSANDEVAVWNETAGEFVTFTTTGDGNFSATAVPGAVFTTAYYPASIAVAGDPAKVNLAASYTQAEATGGKFFAMTATANGDQLDFTHIASLLKITINDVPASATQLTLSSDATLCGQFTVGTDASSNKVITAGSTASTVSVTLSNSAKTDLAFYFPVPTGTYNYTITLGDGTTTMLTKSTTSAKEINRATFHGLKAVTVEYPMIEEKLIGFFSYKGEPAEWSSSKLLPFETTDIYGWIKAAGMEMIDDHVAFKFYKDGTYTGINGENCWRAEQTLLENVAVTSGAGNDIVLHGYSGTIDIYYNPTTHQLFSLPANSDFAIPVYTEVHADSFSLIGAVNNTSWDKDFFPVVYGGQNDWRVVKNVSTVNNKLFFKFRQNLGWTTQFGARFTDTKISGRFFQTGSNDATVSDNATKTYDVYLKSDCSFIYVLEAGTDFSEPTVSEIVDIYTLVGNFRYDNKNYYWEEETSLSLSPVEGQPYYVKIEGVGVNTEKSSEGLKFKFIKGKQWNQYEIGFTTETSVAAGHFHNAYMTGSGPSESSGNVQISDPTGTYDIYLKIDGSSIGIFTHGATVTFP